MLRQQLEMCDIIDELACDMIWQRLKKKKTRKWESKGANGLKTLLLGETVAKKKKKSSKKQMTMSQSTDEEEFMATMNAFGQGLVLLSSNK